MNRVPGTENQRWTVTFQDAADGTGDMIVPLPDAQRTRPCYG